jgi:hypothetical protein
MPKVIVTAQVQDPVKWEAGFRTHGDLFRTIYSLNSPINFAIAGNEVTICMEPENLTSFKEAMASEATVEAMTSDGVKRETVKTLVLDKEMKL